jgi:hypothetical protein
MEIEGHVGPPYLSVTVADGTNFSTTASWNDVPCVPQSTGYVRQAGEAVFCAPEMLFNAGGQLRAYFGCRDNDPDTATHLVVTTFPQRETMVVRLGSNPDLDWDHVTCTVKYDGHTLPSPTDEFYERRDALFENEYAEFLQDFKDLVASVRAERIVVDGVDLAERLDSQLAFNANVLADTCVGLCKYISRLLDEENQEAAFEIEDKTHVLALLERGNQINQAMEQISRDCMEDTTEVIACSVVYMVTWKRTAGGSDPLELVYMNDPDEDGSVDVSMTCDYNAFLYAIRHEMAPPPDCMQPDAWYKSRQADAQKDFRAGFPSVLAAESMSNHADTWHSYLLICPTQRNALPTPQTTVELTTDFGVEVSIRYNLHTCLRRHSFLSLESLDSKDCFVQSVQQDPAAYHEWRLANSELVTGSDCTATVVAGPGGADKWNVQATIRPSLNVHSYYMREMSGMPDPNAGSVHKNAFAPGEPSVAPTSSLSMYFFHFHLFFMVTPA